MSVNCGCHCIVCKGTNLKTYGVSEPDEDGYYDMHHTCADCGAHFDHLDGQTFDTCDICGFHAAGRRGSNGGSDGNE